MTFFRSIIFTILFYFSFQITAENNHFHYEMDVDNKIIFNFSKSLIQKIGVVTITNTASEISKFKYFLHSPTGYLWNRKTKKITHLPIILDEIPEKRTVDSFFLALLDSATFHYKLKPKKKYAVALFLNVNFYPKPRELKTYMLENAGDLEYHIFNPPKISTTANTLPDFIVANIAVFP